MNRFCLLAISLSFPVILFSQYNESIDVYPFTQGSREDSIKNAVTRVSKLINARVFYEKSYLSKDLIYIPFEVVVTPGKPFFIAEEIDKLDLPESSKKVLNKSRKLYQKQLRKAIRISNKELKRDFRHPNNVQRQESVLKLDKVSHYEFVFVPKKQFEYEDPEDPRENGITTQLELIAEQELLGIPYNLNGFINSSNYTRTDFYDQELPELITKILEENLRLSIRLISSQEQRQHMKDVKIITRELPGNAKLWVSTDTRAKQIYLSPYFIRAVFNISYYQVPLLKLAENSYSGSNSSSKNEEERAIRRVRILFNGKTGSRVREIDSAYFNNFVDLFSKNLQLVIGHELAHLYNTSLSDHQLEIACDCHAAQNLLQKYNKLDLGVFETLLINSIKTGETDFWGRSIDPEKLRDRFVKLKKYQETKATPSPCDQ